MRIASPVVSKLAASGRARFRSRAGVVALLFLAASAGRPLQSQVNPDLYTSEQEKSPKVDPYYQNRFREDARAEQEKFRRRVAIADAVGDDVPTVAKLDGVNEATRAVPQAPLAGQGPLAIIGLVALSVTFVVRRFFPDTVLRLQEKLAPWNPFREDVEEDADNIRMEGRAFAEFVSAFKTGPSHPPAEASPPSETAFWTSWPQRLGEMRKQFHSTLQATDEQSRGRLLRDLSLEMQALKSETGAPEFLPVWQLAGALEGLLKQLTDRTSEITASTLRTVAAGVDVLNDLFRPGLDAQLLTRRPIRLLAVDDDPVSRHAVAFALKRALHEPDLADNGESGLVLAQEHCYDVIFLDVEMPGMNGFELCTQIRKTLPNRRSPVVFVTSNHDFNARVQSALRGGCDLIAKPFLTFELAVKALTLTIQNRLRASVEEVEASQTTWPAEVIAAPLPEPDAVPALTDIPLPVPPAPAGETAVRDSEDIATEFLTRAPEHLGWASETLHSALTLADKSTWLTSLADVYLRLNSFTPEEQFTKEHPALRLSAALAGLMRKLLQSSEPPTKATMRTVTTAIETLQDCCAGAAIDFAPMTTLQMLVVDDDPIARRALTGVLQTSFPKPANAESGSAALMMAAEKRFDVIFLDVLMPGMDGLEVFARLRSEGLNLATPVVFVTGLSDLGSFSEVSASGDCDIVVKPFQGAELLVKTLTILLRRKAAPALVAC